jgi:serine phosphatase RsbU (regulator of sigma subunit)
MTITAFSFRNNGRVQFSGLHQKILIYRASSGLVENIPSAGIWLSPWDMSGLSVDNEIILSKGDTLLLFTDGITEAKNKDKEMFSEERLVEIFKECGERKTDDIRDTILEELKGYNLDDDMSMVILKKR